MYMYIKTEQRVDWQRFSPSSLPFPHLILPTWVVVAVVLALIQQLVAPNYWATALLINKCL